MSNNQPEPPEMNRAQRRQMAHLAKKYRPRGKCPFPGCGHTFFQEKEQPNACLDHRKLIGDVIFILDHLKTPEAIDETGKGGPKLFIPKPGMSNQAIEEALKNPKGGKKQ